MFKKPLSEAKTSAPLRSSDRRKLRQRVLQVFEVAQEDGDLLVPEGILSQKFSTHLDEPGILYLSPDGDPLWFTVGKGSETLIPTVYTLWKRPDLLPFVSTPAAVIPKLVGGADLMIPGVIQHMPSLAVDQLVSITQYHHGKVGPPLAVGVMAVSGETLSRAEEVDVKGKAVYLMHAWKDHLWEMGRGKKMDVPDVRDVLSNGKETSTQLIEDGTIGDHEEPNDIGHYSEAQASSSSRAPTPPEHEPAAADEHALTAEDVSSCLRSALLQALSTTLSTLPQSAFPMSASSFWTSYILPARPYYALGSRGLADASSIDVKMSTHKSVKVFLKACAKEGLIKLKDSKSDVVVAAIYPQHPAVAAHRSHRTIKDEETKREKIEARERDERAAEQKKKGEIQVIEFWKPHGNTLQWFIAAKQDTLRLYTLSDLKTILNEYVIAKTLINPREQQYINVGDDRALLAAVTSKNSPNVDFLKRDELMGQLVENMQSWHEVAAADQDAVRKKGRIRPISVVVKIRQGRKASTLITGFEPFLLEADYLAEELRRVCASATSVSPIPGKTIGMEIMVQGKQIQAVTELLMTKGISKKWIESDDLTDKKKK